MIAPPSGTEVEIGIGTRTGTVAAPEMMTNRGARVALAAGGEIGKSAAEAAAPILDETEIHDGREAEADGGIGREAESVIMIAPETVTEREVEAERVGETRGGIDIVYLDTITGLRGADFWDVTIPFLTPLLWTSGITK